MILCETPPPKVVEFIGEIICFNKLVLCKEQFYYM